MLGVKSASESYRLHHLHQRRRTSAAAAVISRCDDGGGGHVNSVGVTNNPRWLASSGEHCSAAANPTRQLHYRHQHQQQQHPSATHVVNSRRSSTGESNRHQFASLVFVFTTWAIYSSHYYRVTVCARVRQFVRWCVCVWGNKLEVLGKLVFCVVVGFDGRIHICQNAGFDLVDLDLEIRSKCRG